MVAVLYAAGGSLLTILLGRPLIRLNYDQLDREANFRSANPAVPTQYFHHRAGDGTSPAGHIQRVHARFQPRVQQRPFAMKMSRPQKTHLTDAVVVTGAAVEQVVDKCPLAGLIRDLHRSAGGLCAHAFEGDVQHARVVRVRVDP